MEHRQVNLYLPHALLDAVRARRPGLSLSQAVEEELALLHELIRNPGWETWWDVTFDREEKAWIVVAAQGIRAFYGQALTPENITPGILNSARIAAKHMNDDVAGDVHKKLAPVADSVAVGICILDAISRHNLNRLKEQTT